MSAQGQRARAGFTLIEILAVVLIVGILSTILIVNLGEASEAAQMKTTETNLRMLEGVLDQYANEEGDYPPSSFHQDTGVPADGLNVGVEAMVVALWSKGWEAGGSLEADDLINLDNDRAARNLGDLGRELLEVADAWGNPVAYFHHRDYEAVERPYVTLDPETHAELTTFPKAFKNATTGRYFRNTKYQLISAGPDAQFGTDDDITPFERK